MSFVFPRSQKDDRRFPSNQEIKNNEATERQSLMFCNLHTGSLPPGYPNPTDDPNKEWVVGGFSC